MFGKWMMRDPTVIGADSWDFDVRDDVTVGANGLFGSEVMAVEADDFRGAFDAVGAAQEVFAAVAGHDSAFVVFFVAASE